MELLRSHIDLDDFFSRLVAAPGRALLLDYDGTLAPFAVERDQAVPYPGVRDCLQALIAAGRTRLIIISGRALHDLTPLLALDPLPELWGSHGWEWRLPDGTYHPPALGLTARRGLAQAIEAAVGFGLNHALERKPASVALHWRGLAPRTAAAMRNDSVRLWTPIARAHELALHPFDGGLELRVPGQDKGNVVRHLLGELDAEAAVAYCGDDLTDEDAFQALGARGLRVLVRPELRDTAADVWIRPPDELLAWLQRWL